MNKFQQTKKLLTETEQFMGKHGVHPIGNYREILAEDTLFDLYVDSLAEGLREDVKTEFKTIAPSLREGLLSETAYGFNPVAPLVMPIFRKMWPQLVVREALTVMPMETPEIVHAFMMAVAKIGDTEYELPNLNQSVSVGTPFGDMTLELPPYELNLPAAVNILEANGYTNATAHLAKDIVIVGAVRADGTDVDMYVEPDDDGNFAFEVQCGNFIDNVSGNVDYFNGVISASGTRSAETSNKVSKLTIVGSITQAEEMYAPKISFKHVKVRINAIDHEIQAEWSIQYEQDAKAYFNLDIQSQLVDTFGKVVAMDIDRRLLSKIMNETTRFNPTSVGSGTAGDRFTFSKTPTGAFAFGAKEWINQIVLKINDLSAKIYTDTNIDVANVILCNPLDVAMLKSTNEYAFKGDAKGGDYGDMPVVGTLADSWKILSSPVIPQGYMPVLLQPDNPDNAVFVFAPYRPLTITPWPLGRKPAMSFLSRYGCRFVRREGVGILRVIA